MLGHVQHSDVSALAPSRGAWGQGMKVLVCYDNRLRADSTGIYFLNAFRALGHEVDHVLPDQIHNVHGGYDLYFRCDDGLSPQNGGAQWNANLHPSVLYEIDCHIETDWRVDLAKRGNFDKVAVCHSVGLDLPWGRESHYMPVGCDPDVHYMGKPDKIFDLAFIGNLHNGLAGPRIEALDVAFKAAPNFFYGSRMFREMAEKYAESKIVLNRSINGDLNMRFYEGLCSGSCVVTDRVPDLEKLGFVDKSHYFGYSSMDELRELIEMLLKNDAYRERVAQKGREEVLRNHTYKHRVAQMLEQFGYLNEQEKQTCNLR